MTCNKGQLLTQKTTITEIRTLTTDPGDVCREKVKIEARDFYLKCDCLCPENAIKVSIQVFNSVPTICISTESVAECVLEH